MLATRGFEELLHKEPYLKLVDTADQTVDALHDLARTNFDDGHMPLRWQASLNATWQARTAAVRDRLQLQKQADSGLPSPETQRTVHTPAQAMQTVG